MKNTDNLPIIAFETQPDWEAWLEEHHTNTKGIWLKLAKKDTGIASVSYTEALEGALCYGWIDGQKASFDEQYWLQKFTPRSPKSIWSKVNCGKATVLMAEGRMQPAGMQQVELAKADGRWEAAYESQSKITVPADFQSALDKNQQARDCFTFGWLLHRLEITQSAGAPFNSKIYNIFRPNKKMQTVKSRWPLLSLDAILPSPWLHQLLKGSLLSLAQAATERGQQVKPDIGVVLKAMAQETAEFPERQLQHGDLIYRRDRRRAGQII